MRLLAIFMLAACISCARQDRPEDATLADMDIPIHFLEELHSAGAKGDGWTRSAVEVALRMQGLSPCEETEKNYTISIEHIPEEGKIVTHARGIPDDSFYETYSVVMLRRAENGDYWIPREYRSCWKGRGLRGWSTEHPD